MSQTELLVSGEKPKPLERDFTIVGTSFHRREGIEKVTGRALYAGDIKRPGMIYAKILRSPYAHARIKRINISKAEALPGVKAILCKDNCTNWFTYWYFVEQPAFPEMITYHGQEVAAVAAEDMDTALKAVELIEVEYEPLPVVVDPEEAMKPDAPFVEAYEGRKDSSFISMGGLGGKRQGNILAGKPFILQRGDVEKGFREADFILEEKFSTPPHHHSSLQTRTCVAEWNGKELTIWESAQGVWQPKEQLAKSLSLPLDSVRVIVKYQGGGFGSKAGAQRFSNYAAKLAMLTKRPVRLELTRAEEFTNHPRRQTGTFWIKTGFKKDGTMTAMQGRCVLSIGSGGLYDIFLFDVHNAIAMPFLLYQCPNVHLEQYGVYTNTQYTGPMRSPQNTSGVYAIESHIDRVAAELNIDPLDIRAKNYPLYGDQEKKIPYSAKHQDECMWLVAKAIGWEKRKELSTSNQNSTKKKGIGIANYIFHGVGVPPYKANAEILIYGDGSIELKTGIVDIGGGASTSLSMIAAEELGALLEDVKVTYGDSGPTKYAPASHASRIIPEMGPAVLQAAYIAKKKLFHFAAPMLKTSLEELESSKGRIYRKLDPSNFLTFKEVSASLPEGEVIRAEGSRVPNPEVVRFATFGSQACEVEVDTETGHVDVLRIATAHEFGRALNPKFCVNQAQGGVVMGIAHALFEESITDIETGIMLNPDLHQYRLCTSLEFPHLNAFNVEAPDPYFAYSAKGGGEGINTPTPATVRNAVCNAIGVWINDLPLTPKRILDALAKAYAKS